MKGETQQSIQDKYDACIFTNLLWFNNTPYDESPYQTSRDEGDHWIQVQSQPLVAAACDTPAFCGVNSRFWIVRRPISPKGHDERLCGLCELCC